MAETLAAYLDGDSFAGRILHTGDYKVHLKRIIQQLTEINDYKPDDLPSSSDALQPPDAIQLIVGRGRDEARTTFRYVQRWLKGATRVTFCDPYFLQWRASEFFPAESDYVDALISLIPSTARHVDIFCNGLKLSVRKAFYLKAKEGRRVRIFNTQDVHDRFVVRDDEVKVIGTSFGGFGNKIFAVLDLSPDDAEIVKRDFDRIRAANVGR
jgi:hypothetical protein